MPLRIATLETTTRQDTLSAQQWRDRIGVLHRSAVAAAAFGNAEAITELYESLASWGDPQRVFQARVVITESVCGAGQGGAWLQTYPAAAKALLRALEAQPNEPVLLNLAGVLLYEIGQPQAAVVLFKASARLDPSLPHVQDNLRQAKSHSARKRQLVPAALRAKGTPLAARATRVAQAARAASGLTISLCMIVKDEEEMLPGCLEAVSGAVDEIIVVDTGSSDRTVEIAESFGARVLRFPWNGSFADARNVGLEAASGDWLFYLDADEHLVPEDAAKIRTLLGRTWREGFHLVETNYTGGEDAGTSVTHLALRIFRNRPEYRFEGRIHEQKTGKMPTYLPARFEATTIRIRHYGYLNSRVSAKEKSVRNIELLLAEAKEAPSPFNSFNLGSEYMMLGDAAASARHFDAAWEALQAAGEWTSVGYAPILASRLARARREAGRIAEAREALAVAIAAMPDHTDLHFELALCARAERDLDTAERIALHCVELGDAPPRYASIVGSGTYLALCLLGEIAQRRGDREQAHDYFMRSLRGFPDYVAPVLHAAGYLIAAGAGLAELRAELQLTRPSATLLAATACLEARRLAEAETLFAEVIAHQPGNDAARIGLAEARLAGRDWAGAVEAAAGVPPDSALAGSACGEILFAHATAGDEPALREGLAAAESVKLVPADRLLYAAWADVLAGNELPRFLPAAAGATAATALEALLRVREFGAFEKLAAVADAIAIPRADWRETLARIYLRQGFLKSAADEWIASVNEAPTARAFVGLAQVAYARELPDHALQLAEQALRLEPGEPTAGALVEALRARAAA